MEVKHVIIILEKNGTEYILQYINKIFSYTIYPN